MRSFQGKHFTKPEFLNERAEGGATVRRSIRFPSLSKIVIALLAQPFNRVSPQSKILPSDSKAAPYAKDEKRPCADSDRSGELEYFQSTAPRSLVRIVSAPPVITNPPSLSRVSAVGLIFTSRRSISRST